MAAVMVETLAVVDRGRFFFLLVGFVCGDGSGADACAGLCARACAEEARKRMGDDGSTRKLEPVLRGGYGGTRARTEAWYQESEPVLRGGYGGTRKVRTLSGSVTRALLPGGVSQ
eukprot:2684267-Rhodomonas_salina.1